MYFPLMGCMLLYQYLNLFALLVTSCLIMSVHIQLGRVYSEIDKVARDKARKVSTDMLCMYGRVM